MVLDHHHKDMILINWVMSTILISWMIFVNLPGKQKVLSKLYVKKMINGRISVRQTMHLLSHAIGFHEDYSDTTRKLLENVIRKGIGVFVLALLTSFLISAAIHYLQVVFFRALFKRRYNSLRFLFYF